MEEMTTETYRTLITFMK